LYLNKKLLFVLGLVVCIITLLASISVLPGCAGKGTTQPTGTQPAKVYELKFCVQHPYVDPMVSVINEAQKKWLWEKSDGRIKMTIIPSAGAVSSASELYDAAKTGIVDMACHSAERTAGRFVATDVIMIPHITTWPSSLQVAMTLRALYDKYQDDPEVQKEFAGVKMITFHCSSVDVINTMKKQVTTPADLKNMPYQVGGEYKMRGMKALGVSVVSLDPSEWGDSASKGIIEGFEGNYQALFIFGVAPYIKYSTKWTSGADYFFHVMNQDYFNKLPTDLQGLFSWQNQETDSKIFGWKFDQDEIAAKAKLEEMMGHPALELTPDQEKAFNDIVAPIADEWIADANSKGLDGAAILADTKKFLAQYAYPAYYPDMGLTLDEWSALPAVPE